LTLQDKINKRMENQKAILSIIAIFKGADNHDWTSVENVMTKNVLLDYTSFTGGEPAMLTPKQITDSWAGFLPGFDNTDHQLTNFKVDINHTFATVTCEGKADHFIDEKVWTVEGNYETELVQENDNWLVSKLKFNFSQQSGNLKLPAEATNCIKK
jgi:SnoaL-like domain